MSDVGDDRVDDDDVGDGEVDDDIEAPCGDMAMIMLMMAMTLGMAPAALAMILLMEKLVAMALPAMLMI